MYMFTNKLSNTRQAYSEFNKVKRNERYSAYLTLSYRYWNLFQYQKWPLESGEFICGAVCFYGSNNRQVWKYLPTYFESKFNFPVTFVPPWTQVMDFHRKFMFSKYFCVSIFNMIFKICFRILESHAINEMVRRNIM